MRDQGEGPVLPEALNAAPAQSAGPTAPAPAGPVKFDQDQVESALFEAVREVRGRSADDGQDTQRVLRTLTHRGSHTIHQIPWAAQSVLTLLRRRGLGLSELTRVIEKDPSLSQLLLRHANSAFYAIPGEPVVSIKRAFTLGLLHDVGKLVFFDHVSNQRKHLRRDLNLPAEFIGTSLAALHGLLGALAVLEWGMDGPAACAVMHHHTPSQAPLAAPMAEVLFLAERLDLARERDEVLDVEVLWGMGSLQGPKDPFIQTLESSSEAA